VIVAVLTPNLKAVLGLPGAYRWVALILGGLAVVTPAGSAIAVAGTL
jgi:hypothetical protein